ncbi:hypothetical protein HDV00_004765 [Rhizophlyctis rosea]|nr:hypothetical protein HDV00_004765 [Rhizophlyctis rosea]
MAANGNNPVIEVDPRDHPSKADAPGYISALHQYCQKNQFPMPLYTYPADEINAGKLQSAFYLYPVSLTVNGHEFRGTGFQNKTDARQCLAYAAVKHFRDVLKVPYFSAEAWVSKLQRLCQERRQELPKYDISQATNPGPFRGRSSYDFPKKQEAKEDAARVAYETLSQALSDGWAPSSVTNTPPTESSVRTTGDDGADMSGADIVPKAFASYDKALDELLRINEKLGKRMGGPSGFKFERHEEADHTPPKFISTVIVRAAKYTCEPAASKAAGREDAAKKAYLDLYPKAEVTSNLPATLEVGESIQTANPASSAHNSPTPPDMIPPVTPGNTRSAASAPSESPLITPKQEDEAPASNGFFTNLWPWRPPTTGPNQPSIAAPAFTFTGAQTRKRSIDDTNTTPTPNRKRSCGDSVPTPTTSPTQKRPHEHTQTESCCSTAAADWSYESDNEDGLIEPYRSRTDSKAQKAVKDDTESYTQKLKIMCEGRGYSLECDFHHSEKKAGVGCLLKVAGQTFASQRSHRGHKAAREDVCGDAWKYFVKVHQGSWP